MELSQEVWCVDVVMCIYMGSQNPCVYKFRMRVHGFTEPMRLLIVLANL